MASLSNHHPALKASNDNIGSFDEVIKEVDSIIANCMKNVTHNEREQAYLEVHGISVDDVQETPEAIEKALTEMKSLLDQNNNSNDPALVLPTPPLFLGVLVVGSLACATCP